MWSSPSVPWSSLLVLQQCQQVSVTALTSPPVFTPSLTSNSFVKHLPFFPTASLSLYTVLGYATFKLHSGCTSRRTGVTSTREGSLGTPASDSSSLSPSLGISARKGHRKSFSQLPVFTWEGQHQLPVMSSGQCPAAISLFLRFSPLPPITPDHPCPVLPPPQPCLVVLVSHQLIC